MLGLNTGVYKDNKILRIYVHLFFHTSFECYVADVLYEYKQINTRSFFTICRTPLFHCIILLVNKPS